MIWISCHVVGPMQTSAREVGGEIYPAILSFSEKPVFQYLTLGTGSVSVKTQKRCPRIRTGPDHTALKTRLQTERFSAKKQPQAPAPQKTAVLGSSAAPHAYFVYRSTLGGSPVTAGRFGAAIATDLTNTSGSAEAMTPAQLTPNPLPDEDDAETPQAPPASDAEDAPTPKKEDAAPAKAIRRAKRA